MISFNNQPTNFVTNNEDFTINAYLRLLESVKTKFDTISYCDSFNCDNFILWRHDVDYSLQHALSLAKLEHQRGIHATYFINIHSEFYNALASDETKIIRNIRALGHDIGIHLDANYYKVDDISALERALEIELLIFEKILGSRPKAFSFHNPNATHLFYDAQYYAGLINCYSTYFKQEVNYVSDSNGYWRFQSIQGVLDSKEINKLQVLTHPGWWQEHPNYPRERIHKIVFQRAADTIRNYDEQLELDNRENLTYVPQNLMTLIKLELPISIILDFLFNQKLHEQIYLLFHDFIQTQNHETILPLVTHLSENEDTGHNELLHDILDQKNKLSELETFTRLSAKEKIYVIDKMSLVYLHFIQKTHC